MTDQKSSIIALLNSRHSRKLGHILRHHANLTKPNATCSDITFDHILINNHRIPFSPPLSSWTDVEDRVITMDDAARTVLGVADVHITEYVPPRGSDWAVVGGVLFYVGCAATLSWIRPGSGAWDAVDAVFPGGAGWYRWVVETCMAPVLALHLAETVALDRLRMNKYGVPRWSALWWKWELDCFVEGVMTFKRIEAVAEEKRQRAAKSD